MEHTRTVGRRIGGGANSITSIGDDMHGMQLEMVATSSEIREGKETKEEKLKNQNKNEGKGSETNDTTDATVVNINAVTVSMEEEGVVEWKLQLRHLEVAEKTTDVLNVFKALHAVVKSTDGTHIEQLWLDGNSFDDESKKIRPLMDQMRRLLDKNEKRG